MTGAAFPLWAWLVFAGLVLALLLLDLFVLHRNARKISFKESLWLSGVLDLRSPRLWSFYLAYSRSGGGWRVPGGLPREWSLSLDNVFVFAVIFSPLPCPRSTATRSCSGA